MDDENATLFTLEFPDGQTFGVFERATEAVCYGLMYIVPAGLYDWTWKPLDLTI